MTTSSSDDEGASPVVKRQRSTKSTMVYGILDDLANDNSTDTFDYDYSNRVSRHWGNNQPQQSIYVKKVKQLLTSNSEREEPVESSTNSSKTVSASQSITTVHVDQESKQEDMQVMSICSLVEQSAVKLTSQTVQIKEPTPPPSPGSPRLRSGRVPKKRLKKGVKKAMTTLAKLQNVLQYDDIISSRQEVLRSDVAGSSLSPICVDVNESAKITVKVRCPSGLRRYQVKQVECFARVISDIADNEDVDESKVVMFLHDKTIHGYDTPKTIALTVTDFIECHIRREAVETNPSPQLPDDSSSSDTDLRLHLQYEDKSKTTLVMRKDEPMLKLMQEFCKLRGISATSVMFQFDGEIIDLSETPQDLDIETDYCIDVIRKKK